jgi:hypothetical protein
VELNISASLISLNNIVRQMTADICMYKIGALKNADLTYLQFFPLLKHTDIENTYLVFEIIGRHREN